jgi:hypothetical protein
VNASGSSLSFTTMSLPSLPIDVLLVVFQNLDTTDVVRIGTVSPLIVAVGLDFSAHPQSLALITLDLQRTPCGRTSPSRLGRPTRKVVPERSGAQARDASAHFPLHARAEGSRHRFCQDAHPLGKVSGPRCSKRFDENGLAAKGVIGMPGVREFRLLPGGKSLIVIDNRGGMTLRRITLEGGQASLPVVASVERDKRRTMGSWNRLLTAMSPCPILVHERATE